MEEAHSRLDDVLARAQQAIARAKNLTSALARPIQQPGHAPVTGEGDTEDRRVVSALQEPPRGNAEDARLQGNENLESLVAELIAPPVNGSVSELSSEAVLATRRLRAFLSLQLLTSQSILRQLHQQQQRADDLAARLSVLGMPAGARPPQDQQDSDAGSHAEPLLTATATAAVVQNAAHGAGTLDSPPRLTTAIASVPVVADGEAAPPSVAPLYTPTNVASSQKQQQPQQGPPQWASRHAVTELGTSGRETPVLADSSSAMARPEQLGVPQWATRRAVPATVGTGSRPTWLSSSCSTLSSAELQQPDQMRGRQHLQQYGQEQVQEHTHARGQQQQQVQQQEQQQQEQPGPVNAQQQQQQHSQALEQHTAQQDWRQQQHHQHSQAQDQPPAQPDWRQQPLRYSFTRQSCHLDSHHQQQRQQQHASTLSSEGGAAGAHAVRVQCPGQQACGTSTTAQQPALVPHAWFSSGYEGISHELASTQEQQQAGGIAVQQQQQAARSAVQGQWGSACREQWGTAVHDQQQAAASNAVQGQWGSAVQEQRGSALQEQQHAAGSSDAQGHISSGPRAGPGYGHSTPPIPAALLRWVVPQGVAGVATAAAPGAAAATTTQQLEQQPGQHSWACSSYQASAHEHGHEPAPMSPACAGVWAAPRADGSSAGLGQSPASRGGIATTDISAVGTTAGDTAAATSAFSVGNDDSDGSGANRAGGAAALSTTSAAGAMGSGPQAAGPASAAGACVQYRPQGSAPAHEGSGAPANEGLGLGVTSEGPAAMQSAPGGPGALVMVAQRLALLQEQQSNTLQQLLSLRLEQLRCGGGGRMAVLWKGGAAPGAASGAAIQHVAAAAKP